MSHSARILIADSEPEWRNFAIKTLRQAGYNAHGTETSESTLSEIVRGDAELILTDAGLTNLVRTLAIQQQNTRFVVFTTSPSVKDALVAYRYGALDYTTKAFEQGSLLDTIRRALNKQPVQSHLVFTNLATGSALI